MPDAGHDADDLRELFPEIEIRALCPDSGDEETVTVRELSFIEQLRMQAEAPGLIRALAEAVPDGETDAAAIDAAMGAHAGEWLAAISLAAERPVTWLERLRGRDAMRVSDAMWELNGFFFVTRALVQAMTKPKEPDSERSSTNSSGPATDPASGTLPDAIPDAGSNGSGS